ncbi:MAG: PEP-CTERM sorting domain-containing protein [Phycisphaerae bacterium]|nr:PEP-CTERM sorting domain-containing protein [Phycisphaerae bacterium]
MKKWLIIAALICAVFSGNAAAEHKWTDQVGYWSQTARWTGDGIPDGTSTVKIGSGSTTTTICTLNTDESFWELNDKSMDIENGATLVIEDGGAVKPARIQIGYNGTAGHVVQTGGLLSIYKDKLYVGRGSGVTGATYTISGGTITYNQSDGAMFIGYEGGQGKLTIEGADASLTFKKFFVAAGADGAATAGTGTIEFKVGSAGVSPISVDDSWYVDYGGESSTAHLLVSLTAAPPAGDILLFEDKGGGTGNGTFDTINGIAALEGTEISLDYGNLSYIYELTYIGVASGDSSANDMMLLYVETIPEPATMFLLSLGLVAVRRKK